MKIPPHIQVFGDVCFIHVYNAMTLGGDINMDKRTREKLISDFKAQKYKKKIDD